MDLYAFCQWSPEDSALHASMNPGAIPLQTQVLGLLEYHLHRLWWAKTDDARKKRNRPEPLEFLRPKSEHDEYVPMTTDNMDDFLGWSPRKKAG